MSSLTNTKAGAPSYGPAAGAPRARSAVRAIGGLGYDWIFICLSLVFLGGLYLDGWAHNHGKVDNSFFTPWHAFFYAGYALIGLLLVATLVRSRMRHYGWRQTMPPGYSLSLLGVLIFAAGGVGDLIWHELFGVEEGFEALLSPTHLALIWGLALIVSGPLRAAWIRTGARPSWPTHAPALLSLAALISAFTFITMYAHPIVYSIAGARHPEFNSDTGQVAGILGILITAAVLMGPTMLAMRRWTLPPGSLTVVWGINLVAMTAVNYDHGYMFAQAAIMFAAICVIDMLRIRLQPSIRNYGGWRVFAFIAPVLYFGAYILALLLTEGSNWSIHLLGGTIMLAGIVGWLLSYLLIPPRMPVL